jgi:hypothetical protein
MKMTRFRPYLFFPRAQVSHEFLIGRKLNTIGRRMHPYNPFVETLDGFECNSYEILTRFCRSSQCTSVLRKYAKKKRKAERPDGATNNNLADAYFLIMAAIQGKPAISAIEQMTADKNHFIPLAFVRSVIFQFLFAAEIVGRQFNFRHLDTHLGNFMFDRPISFPSDAEKISNRDDYEVYYERSIDDPTIWCVPRRDSYGAHLKFIDFGTARMIDPVTNEKFGFPMYHLAPSYRALRADLRRFFHSLFEQIPLKTMRKWSLENRSQFNDLLMVYQVAIGRWNFDQSVTEKMRERARRILLTYSKGGWIARLRSIVPHDRILWSILRSSGRRISIGQLLKLPFFGPYKC